MEKENKIKEPLMLKLKNKFIKDKLMTVLLILILFITFIVLNAWVQSIDLAQIDVTENKIYTLSDNSKKEIANVSKDVKIYSYGYDENNTVIDLIKQYSKENNKIQYELLTEENNKQKIDELGLQSGYPSVVVEVENTSTILDGNSDFYSYDYTTNQEIDMTEQKITNAILNLTINEKPKVYILSGHGEYNESNIGLLTTYLSNEAYEYESLNLLSTGKVPEDCSVLLILSPTNDLLEDEVDNILEYINNGGNIIYAKDTNGKILSQPNFQKVLDEYGVEVENGFVYETSSNNAVSEYPNIIMPRIEYSSITSELYTDGGYLVFVYAQKIKTSDEDTANSLGVEYEKILTSSDNARYIKDLSQNINTAYQSAEEGKVDVAILATKTLSDTEDENQDNAKKSKLIVIGNSNFITDQFIVSEQYPMSYIGNNKDFMLNSIANLTDRTDTLVIRKEMNSSTYTPTAMEDTIVKIIIFGIPILIIIAGIIVWNRRKNKR